MQSQRFWSGDGSNLGWERGGKCPKEKGNQTSLASESFIHERNSNSLLFCSSLALTKSKAFDMPKDSLCLLLGLPLLQNHLVKLGSLCLFLSLFFIQLPSGLLCFREWLWFYFFLFGGEKNVLRGIDEQMQASESTQTFGLGSAKVQSSQGGKTITDTVKLCWGSCCQPPRHIFFSDVYLINLHETACTLRQLKGSLVASSVTETALNRKSSQVEPFRIHYPTNP